MTHTKLFIFALFGLGFLYLFPRGIIMARQYVENPCAESYK